jgi:hypothetical protein
MKKLAVSLVALLATLALFATLSAAAQGVADTSRPIINPRSTKRLPARRRRCARPPRPPSPLRSRLHPHEPRAGNDRSRRAQQGEVRRAARRGRDQPQLPDIAVESLAEALPDKNARILIYCNNNFSGAEGAFPSKLPSASLNLPTYVALYDYG